MRESTAIDQTVIGYVRVSTAEQVESGAGLAAQRAAIEAHARRIGVQIGRWATDEAVSGSVHPLQRPGLTHALAELPQSRGGVLIVSRTDRIARKASDLLQLVDLAERQSWQLVAVDGSIDTTTPHGRMLTTVMAAAAQLERDLIAQRTREALAARKAAGVRLGRPVRLSESARQRVLTERGAGRTFAAIADGLTADGIPTASGRTRWYVSSVQSVLASIQNDAYASERAAC